MKGLANCDNSTRISIPIQYTKKSKLEVMN